MESLGGQRSFLKKMTWKPRLTGRVWVSQVGKRKTASGWKKSTSKLLRAEAHHGTFRDFGVIWFGGAWGGSLVRGEAERVSRGTRALEVGPVGLDFNPRPAKLCSRHICILLIDLLIVTPHGIWDLKFPYQGSNPCPLQRKLEVLNHWTPGKSPYPHFRNITFQESQREGGLRRWKEAQCRGCCSNSGRRWYPEKQCMVTEWEWGWDRMGRREAGRQDEFHCGKLGFRPLHTGGTTSGRLALEPGCPAEHCTVTEMFGTHIVHCDSTAKELNYWFGSVSRWTWITMCASWLQHCTVQQ